MMDYGERDRVLDAPEGEYTQQLMDSVLHLKRA